jgi:hypothetical protein
MKSNTETLVHVSSVVLVLAAAFTLASCQSTEHANTEQRSSQASTGSEALASETVVASATPVESAPVEPAASPTGLPPDLTASLADTVAAPGETVEIEVQGTHDVVEVQVKGDRGEPFNLALDADSNLWRGVYRVPLDAKTERIALSVTARNELNRWRRVWVFIHVGESTVAPAAATQEDPEEK